MDMAESTCILKVLVGSRAHGLERPDSDYDYRSVFVIPTKELLSLHPTYQTTLWVEGELDTTGWELGHFLQLAVKCNPTILETFVGPVVHSDHFGRQLHDLFPLIWNPEDVKKAFIGYGLNQRKKFLEDKLGMANKYASTYLRVLFQARHLLQTGILPIDMRKTIIFNTLLAWRNGDFTKGQVVDLCNYWQKEVEEAASKCKQQSDLKIVNDFLLFVRQRNW